MVLFVQCYVVFHFLMLFCSFQLTDHVVVAMDHLRTNLPFTDQGHHRRSDCYNGPMYDVLITNLLRTVHGPPTTHGPISS